jgi:hypothetical protein
VVMEQKGKDLGWLARRGLASSTWGKMEKTCAVWFEGF